MLDGILKAHDMASKDIEKYLDSIDKIKALFNKYLKRQFELMPPNQEFKFRAKGRDITIKVISLNEPNVTIMNFNTEKKYNVTYDAFINGLKAANQ